MTTSFQRFIYRDVLFTLYLLMNFTDFGHFQVRLLKQKISRAESRDRRRTQSLKGRESFTLSKDMELKLSQLEAKIEQLLQNEEGSCSPEVSS